MIECRILVLVITGFLDASKTSLIARIFHRWPKIAHATALIVNEYGETGIDHGFLRIAGKQQVAIDAGCICCTLRSDLTDTLMWLHLGSCPRADRPAGPGDKRPPAWPIRHRSSIRWPPIR